MDICLGDTASKKSVFSQRNFQTSSHLQSMKTRLISLRNTPGWEHRHVTLKLETGIPVSQRSFTHSFILKTFVGYLPCGGCWGEKGVHSKPGPHSPEAQSQEFVEQSGRERIFPWSQRIEINFEQRERTFSLGPWSKAWDATESRVSTVWTHSRGGSRIWTWENSDSTRQQIPFPSLSWTRATPATSWEGAEAAMRAHCMVVCDLWVKEMSESSWLW